jgi:murein DD-endopeptidase MepM/ murein hydrolase activator NlpD
MILRLFAFLFIAALEGLNAQAPRLVASPSRPQAGAIVRLSLSSPPRKGDSVVAVRGSLSGEPLHFVVAGRGSWHAIGGIPADAVGTMSARAFLSHASGRIDTVSAAMKLPPIRVVKSEPLAVDSSFSKPMPSETADRINRENARARDIGRKSHASAPLWTGAFMQPRSSFVTGPFGTGRVFNGAVTSRHLGIDFRGGVGDTIKAANRGVVALVDTFYLAGTVVYIDHGAGVVTGYFHMSKPLVARGDTVARGQVIGLVGQTGRVTGPHLHWSARYGAITVNPGDLLKLDPAWYPGRGTTHQPTIPPSTNGPERPSTCPAARS